MIDIRNFVNINFERDKTSTENGSRPIVMLYSGASNQVTEKLIVGANSDCTKFYDDKGVEATIEAPIKKYVTIFFKNGGAKLQIKNGDMPKTADDFKKLPIENIVFAMVGLNSTTALKTYAPILAKLKGVYQKVLLCRDDTATLNTASTADGSDFIACKVSAIEGAEMSIAAYLSKIKAYQVGSPVDYDFTEEFGIEEDLSNTINYGKEDTSLAEIPFNFEMHIANKYLNIGGNTISGKDLVEQFVIIVMEQTTSESVFNTLSAKISGQAGVASIRTALASELDKFTSSGFLATDQVWTKPDLILPNALDDTKPSETVITKNTPLGTGYHIHMFRLAKDGRSAYAVVIIATTKGIRFVEVYGRAI